MLRGALLAATLAGCYSPHVTSGVACTNACPGDDVCIAGFCRPPGYVGDADIDARDDDAPDVDTDGDGLVDRTDNCANVANADQHDEDSDDLGDLCDPCPHVAMGGSTDSDGDGVGDVCDPAPQTPTERWLVFDPLTSRAAAWSPSIGVTFGTDSMVIADGYTRYNIALANFRVQIGGELVVTPNTEHQMVLEFGHEMFSHYYYAELYGDQTEGYVKITRRDADVYNTVDGTMYTGPIPGGAFRWSIDVSVAEQQILFDAVHGATTFPSLAGPTVPPLASSAFVHIGTNAGVTARVDYFALIETMP